MTSASASKPRRKISITHKEKTSGMPVITCRCGAKIMVVPDVKAMSRAVEKHLKSHQTEKRPVSDQDLDSSRDHLIGEIFSKIAN